MANELEHFGIPGMKWGVRRQKSGGSSDGKAAATNKLLSKHSSRKASDLINETKSESFGEKLLRAYDIKKDPKGRYHIGTWTALKVGGTLIAADYIQAYGLATVKNMRSGYYQHLLRQGKGPKWIGDLAWTFGKVVYSGPIR